MCMPGKGHLEEEWRKVAEAISHYHVHIYANNDQNTLFEVAFELAALFRGDIDGPHDVGAVGPHTRPNVEFDVPRDSFGKVVSWLQMNARGLSILIHPRTGNEVADHENAIWIGKPVPFNEAFFDAWKAQDKKKKLG